MAKIGELEVCELNLGGNVFGWTADEEQSFAVLDAEAGGNFIDTADVYSGGKSEAIIGNWLARCGRRDDMVIATKVGSWAERPGLSAKNIAEAADDSLRRLGTDHIDLILRAPRLRRDPARRDPQRVRRAGQGGQGPPHRSLELHCGAAVRSTVHFGPCRLRALRRAAAPLQPPRARPGTAHRRRRPDDAAVFRTGHGVPGREVPLSGHSVRQPARAPRGGLPQRPWRTRAVRARRHRAGPPRPGGRGVAGLAARPADGRRADRERAHARTSSRICCPRSRPT